MRLQSGLRRTRHATGYLVAGLRTALPAMVGWVFIPAALPLSFLLPILPGVVEPLRALANVERARAARELGRPIQRPYPPPRGDLFRRSMQLMRSGSTWRDLAWLILHGFLGLLMPIFAAMTWVTFAATVSAPLWWWAAPRGQVSVIVHLTNWTDAILGPLGAGLICGTLLYFVPPLFVQVQVGYAKVLLGATRREDLAQRVEELAETRAEALEAHGAELRRIERDLHDGTQAQLVTVALRLGLAARRFDADPEGARELFLQARTGVEEALTDLRGVIRGIYPPILSDRGLDGAIRSLAAGRPIPVSVDLPDPGRRCPAAVEAAAYFVVAEALTNIAKHSGAAAARVSLRYHGPYLRIVVSDEGRGGADPAAGSGLAGIRRRVAALDGVTRLTSPAGSGTTLEVDLPCGL